jgi:predicted DNA binding CopG/RHH family protein
MKYKQIKIPDDLHKEIKTAAAKEGLTIIQYLKKLLNIRK